ncbi:MULTISPECIES: HAD family hydrolase [Halococcus]|uniref:HAD-superfamily hydrolase, subfamily IA, variant 3 n=1 Tax=Halococcus salifodinae DSM 8989 TaxID=1227456 RepID=M0N6M0_9EURY|nr:MULTISPECIES: HAD family hydrolase [Halococcus]EMA52784.1 HAD-superfamily hydrolase, subfamily IA, variant 3 [Halococcus salifodinae DSM 8989]
MTDSHETRYEAVFWDIGGVLLDLGSVRAGHRAFVGALADEYDLDEATALETWRDELGTHFRERDGNVFRSARTGYERAIEGVVGHEVAEDDWLPAFERATREQLEPVSETVDTIHALDGRVHQGIVSDIDTWEAERLLAQFGVAAHLDAVTTSEEVGRTKPDGAMFATALEKAGIEPTQTLMIGDRYENDMVGASRAGIHTAAFGGSAADADPDDPVVDHRIRDPRDVLALVGVEKSE